MQTQLQSQPLQLKPSRKESTEKFYEAVKQEYSNLAAKKVKGVRLYSQEYIILQLSEKFYRSPKTIENIVFNRV